MVVFRWADTARFTRAQLARLVEHWGGESAGRSKMELRKAVMNSPKNWAPTGPEAWEAQQALLPVLKGRA